MPQELEITRHGDICIVTMNRPESLNAATPTMLVALTELAGGLIDDKAAQVVVLTGAGKAFRRAGTSSTS